MTWATLGLPGAVASVRMRDLADGSTDVRYAWKRDGLAHVLHVRPAVWRAPRARIDYASLLRPRAAFCRYMARSAASRS